MIYKELKLALGVLGIEERATLGQIKSRHRALVKEHHPDQANGQETEMIKEINAAYKVVSAYCEGYRFCFSEEEFLEQVPEEKLRRQFGWDSIWAGKKEDEE